jgi:acetate---CoA ligase (ADP-forming)
MERSITNLEKNMTYLFNPKSIAIIGASTAIAKMSGRTLHFIVKHKSLGRIFPINAKKEITEIFGVPCFHSLDEIPEPIDQAIIALPAAMIAQQLRECAHLGVKSALIFSSGFAEAGGKGTEMQQEIEEIARAADIALCGPNCQGIINLDKNVISSMTNVLNLDSLVKGSIGFVSQSGALAGSILSLAQKEQIGLSYWVSVGNEAVLEVSDFVRYFVHDPAVKIIAAYVEGMKNADKWLGALRDAAHERKPVVVMKVGKSETGKKAVSSHTGSIAGDDFITDSFFRQNGVTRVSDIDEMFDTLVAFSGGKQPGKGKVGIITTSGGAGIVVADACSDYNVPIASLSVETKESLRQKLPKFASVLNPVDVTAQLLQMMFTEDIDLFKKCLRDLLADKDLNVLIIALTLVIGERAVTMARHIAEVSKETEKPMMVVWMAGDMASEGYEILRNSNIPLYSSVIRCVRALKKMLSYHQSIDSVIKSIDERVVTLSQAPQTEHFKETYKIIEKAGHVVTEHEGRIILSSYGISVPPGGLLTSENDLQNLPNTVRYPLVMKIDSPDILHRTEAKCVKVGIKNKEDLRSAYNQLLKNAKAFNPAARINGVLFEEMIEGDNSLELILGVKIDPVLGPVIILGIGGIFVEVFKEVVCRVAPLTELEARSMIREMRGFKILEGVRGRPRLDSKALEKTLIALSKFSWDFKDRIQEIDINPLFVLEQGVMAADVLIVKKQ